jgi:hypothetical protein
LPHDSQNFSLAVSIANIRRGDVWQEVEVASVGSQAIWPSFGSPVRFSFAIRAGKTMIRE